MNHLYPYIPIAIVLCLALGFGLVNLVISRFIGPRRFSAAKMVAYESGMIPEGQANVRLPIKFYMVAILFLLFDMESIYVIAWAIVFRGKGFEFNSDALGFSLRQFQIFSLIEMLTFLAIVLVGYLYVWRKGGFKWS